MPACAGKLRAPENTTASRFGKLRVLWIGLVVLMVATPLSLLAPGTAWGEWSSQELAARGLGFIPKGLAQLENLWGAPMAGYNVPALGNTSLGYALSAGLGIVTIAIVVWLFTRLLTRSSAVKR